MRRPIPILRNIIHCHSSIRTFKVYVPLLRHAFKCPVLRPEVQSSSPVVAEVFGEGAGSARCSFGGRDGRVHGGVEGISADYLMHVGGGGDAGVYEGVEAFDNELGTGEAEEGVGGVGGGREERR